MYRRGVAVVRKKQIEALERVSPLIEDALRCIESKEELGRAFSVRETLETEGEEGEQ